MKRLLITILALSIIWSMGIEMKAQTSETMNRIQITANGFSFAATLEQNQTAQAFAALLPLTLPMSELNGNEKYYYLSENLPTDATNPGTIREGDIMLYGSSCVVVFYKTFTIGYSYTKIGHIDDVTNLRQALGTGSVSVLFSKEISGISSVQPDASHSREYTISGVTASPQAKGVIITQGKKIIR
ncbi:MAG: hypothetical protein IJ808_05695 [Muribaculaceae bacterium]|nr:hypothetical protein [Muribaculaceae bacterium]